jgi:hypothetical protein
MDYYFIYSGGGGAGDWNGLKRVWKSRMPVVLKSRVLLKFGDIFFNHAKNKKLIRPGRWKQIKSVRKWLADSVDDDYINEQTTLFLDSGTAKVVNQIKTGNSNISPERLVETFQKMFVNNNVLERYIETIKQSNVDYAVTFDIPNPFKRRASVESKELNIFGKEHHSSMVELCAEYANDAYKYLDRNQNQLFTVINGFWEKVDLELFFQKLNYYPDKIAVGGLSGTREKKYIDALLKLSEIIDFNSFEKVHFLGCGGIEKVKAMKKNELNFPHFSVDCATAINRSFENKIDGTKQVEYYDYTSKAHPKVTKENLPILLGMHKKAKNPLFTLSEIKKILLKIIEHQSGSSSHSTYEAKASLYIHNSDVFRVNAL